MPQSPDPDGCARGLAHLLNAQAEVCRGILEQSRQQQRLVEERREDELLSLLGDKQKLMDQHQDLAARAAPFREQWEAGARENAGPEAHKLVEEAWSGLRDVLDEIIRLEDASRNFLEEQKNRVSVDIGKLQQGKMVNRAYGGAATYRPPAQPRYSDKQG